MEFEKDNDAAIAEAGRILRELDKQKAADHDQSEIQQLRKDAERYRVLRNAEYQMLESDPSISDDCFVSYFNDDLDAAVNRLKARRDVAMEAKPSCK